ncbi:MAG TPA: right-handed parallel beta-helix repeat-containing protein [Phycisphaerales bacterium]|nr:right-handed parallel beta-helix repeat-containing protein [Phycisphaerales bacterium]
MNELERRTLLGAAGATALAALATGRAKGAGGGPLNPPAGPVASTLKPLAEVEPRTAINDANTPGTATGRYRITRPGSYYLLDNIGGISGRHAIEIAASDVTIDLCGFQLSGVPASGAFDGISVAAGGLTGLTVVNGTVRNWGRHGVNFATNNPECCRVHAVHAANCSGVGIAAGDRSIVSDCSGTGCGSSGVTAGFHSTILHCVGKSNGFTGISGGGDTLISHCSASDNGTVGIGASGGCVLMCSANGNGTDGISATQGTISGCNAKGNSTGIRGGVGAAIVSCTAAANTQAGFSINDGGSLIDCNAMDNTVWNFVAADGCTVRGCNALANNAFPVQSNFRITGGQNRIEHNNATGGGIGFDVESAGNFLSANTARNNTTNYAVVAGNVCFVLVAATSAAINGASGGISPGTTNPWANFSF